MVSDGAKHYLAQFFFLFSKDYLRITNGMGNTVGVYCGNRTGENVLVAGDQVRIIFHSDDDIQRRGYLLVFTLSRSGKWEHKECDKRVCVRTVNRARGRKRKCC